MILCIVTVKPQNGERKKAVKPQRVKGKSDKAAKRRKEKSGGAEGKTANRKSRTGKAAF